MTALHVSNPSCAFHFRLHPAPSPWTGCGCRQRVCGAGEEGCQQLALHQAVDQRQRHRGAAQQGGGGVCCVSCDMSSERLRSTRACLCLESTPALTMVQPCLPNQWQGKQGNWPGPGPGPAGKAEWSPPDGLAGIEWASPCPFALRSWRASTCGFVGSAHPLSTHPQTGLCQPSWCCAGGGLAPVAVLDQLTLCPPSWCCAGGGLWQVADWEAGGAGRAGRP